MRGAIFAWCRVREIPRSIHAFPTPNISVQIAVRDFEANGSPKRAAGCDAVEHLLGASPFGTAPCAGPAQMNPAGAWRRSHACPTLFYLGILMIPPATTSFGECLPSPPLWTTIRVWHDLLLALADASSQPRRAGSHEVTDSDDLLYLFLPSLRYRRLPVYKLRTAIGIAGVTVLDETRETVAHTDRQSPRVCTSHSKNPRRLCVDKYQSEAPKTFGRQDEVRTSLFSFDRPSGHDCLRTPIRSSPNTDDR